MGHIDARFSSCLKINTAINFIINEDSADILFRVFQNGFY